MMKRMLSLLMALCLVFGMVPAAGFAAEPHMQSGVIRLDMPVQVNPLYADVVDAGELPRTGRADYTTMAEADYVSADQAVDQVREYLKARTENFTINLQLDHFTTDAEEIQSLIAGLIDDAMLHTGDPKEGDYLKWQYGWWGVSGEVSYSGNAGGMVMQIPYAVEYYTTAQQEAELDQAVNRLLAELNLEDACDYEKVSGIYDYIIHHVTYDYDNLNNTGHTLKFTAYAALMNKTAVCQGYALLFYRLALELGVDARLVPGDSNNDGETDHAWNIVELNGRYYNLDATFDSNVGEPYWFLRGSGNFPDHTPDYTWVEDGFAAKYAMASSDFQHTFTETVTKPTCTEEGYTTVTCSCGNRAVKDTVAAAGHIWDEGVVTKEPTDTQLGSITYTCKVCETTRVESIPTQEHEHSYTAVVTAPTCTQKGYTTHTCACGDSYVTDETPATGHNEVPDAAVEATCTKDGKTAGTHCSVCNQVLVKQETIPAPGHTEVVDKAVAATCTETGLTEGKHCSVCNQVLVKQTVTNATGHTEAVDKAVAPTCTETGLTEGKHCSVCGVVLVAQETIAATGHSEVIDAAIPATCTDSGLTEGSHCAVCEAVLVERSVIAALGHTEVVEEAIPATCTESGLTEGKYCSVCEAVLVERMVVDATGHSWDDGIVTREPTETEPGLRVYTCASCGETREEIIPELGHKHVHNGVVTAPTCTEEGYTTYTCACGDTYIDNRVPALGHTEAADAAVAPTCTETGLTEGKHCSVCGEILVAQETVAATGHSWDEGVVTKEPTETETGIRTYSCTVCDTIREETIPTLDHVHVHTSVVTAPTCTEGGYTTFTCACGDSYIDNEVPALGHSEVVDAAEAPTCTETGLTEGKHCSVCGEILVAQEEVPAAGHNFEDGECTVCGEKDPDVTEPTEPSEPEESKPTEPSEPEESEPTEPSEPEESEPTEPSEPEESEPTEPSEPEDHTHKFGDWVTVQEPTGSAEGLEERKCACGETESRPIPKLTNPFSDVKESNYFYESVLWAANKGITSGVSKTQFAPNQACTRAQVVTFLWRAAGEPEPSNAKNPFKDVNPAAYYYKAVLWAVEEGITSGMSKTQFAPNQACTRAQVVTFLWRAKGEPEVKKAENAFTDVNAASYYYKAVLWAVEEEITTGMGNGKFAPDTSCTRGQIVTFLYRAFAKA